MKLSEIHTIAIARKAIKIMRSACPMTKKKIKKTGRKKAHTHFESKRERNDHKVDARNHAIEILYSEPIHTKKKKTNEKLKTCKLNLGKV